MKLFKINPKAKSLEQGSVLSIGNFDGVHRGHQALLKSLLQKSKQLGLASVVVIFEPHPKELFLGHQAPKRIYNLREKIIQLKRLGVDYVFCIDFTPSFAKTHPEQFIQNTLVQELHARFILVGHDFHFGKDRLGNQHLLQKMGQAQGFEVGIFDMFELEGQRISSTGVRDLLKKQDVKNISFCLGRHYSIIGRVIYGQKLARLWGIPTANIAVNPLKLTLSGVFCVNIKICGQEHDYQGVANMGYRPTVDGKKLFLEVHLFDFSGSLYGQFIEVSFLNKLRNEQKFANIEELRKQIEEDIVCAKHYFSQTN
jgi:riboflavin kinase/FMN adenylyltransferase